MVRSSSWIGVVQGNCPVSVAAEAADFKTEISGVSDLQVVMPGLVPGIHVLQRLLP
jgi:hypothetical protein